LGRAILSSIRLGPMGVSLRRREFIVPLGSAAAWPLAAHVSRMALLSHFPAATRWSIYLAKDKAN